MLGFFKKKEKVNNENVRKEVLEINYLKENRVLQEIIRVSYVTKDISEASNRIIQIIRSQYNIQYCTLFLYDGNRFRTSGTNVPFEMTHKLEDLAQAIYLEKCDGKNADAYVVKSEQPINYETGWERGIRYMMFSPLKIDNLLGGILIENTGVTLTKDEMEFFELIVENVALIMQNLIYFKQIVDAANKDGLTGVYNRHYMNNHLENMINQYKQSGMKFSIALFDIDHFKIFNDTYGHLHGDKVLKEVSGFMNREIRSSDVLYRYGGEEFIIFFGETSIDDAAIILNKLRIGIENKR